jgi:hypothetical protein
MVFQIRDQEWLFYLRSSEELVDELEKFCLMMMISIIAQQWKFIISLLKL